MGNGVRKKWVVFFVFNSVILLFSLIWVILNKHDFTAVIEKGYGLYLYGALIAYGIILTLCIAASFFWGLKLSLSPKLLALRDKCLNSSHCVNRVVLTILAGEVILQTVLFITSPLANRAAGVMLLYTTLRIMSIFLLINALIFRFSQRGDRLSMPNGKTWRAVAIVLLVGGLVVLGLQISIQPALSSPYYLGAGAPLVMPQLLLGITSALLVQAIARELADKPKSLRWLDVVVCLAVCSLAFFFWRTTELPVNHFMHESEEGSGILYPFSDSRDYDANAELMLMGEGLSAGQPLPRPLYVFFIGILHKLVGDDFSNLVNAQTAIYALFPALAYLFGKRYFNRETGILFALLFVFREQNLALLSGVLTQSSSRMLLSEFMMTVWLILTAGVGMAWTRKPDSRSLGALAGLTLGMAALVRAQVVVLAPLLVVFIIIASFRKKPLPWRALLWFTAAFLAVVLAWSTRNYIRSSSFTFEDARYTTYLKELLTTDDEPKLLGGGPSETQATPAGLLANTPALVVNSLYSTLHQFPWKADPMLTLSEYVSKQADGEYFPQLNMSVEEWAMLVLHLVLVISGVWVAFRRLGWAGLLPLGIYGLYSVSTAVVGFSGWRFIQPVDWVFLLYWAIGALGILPWLLGLGKESQPAQDQPDLGFGKEWRALPLVLVILLGAMLLPVGEVLLGLSAQKSKAMDPQAIIRESLPEQDAESLLRLAGSEEGLLLSGTLMYPTYLETERDYTQNKLTDEYTGDNQGLSFELFVGGDRQRFYMDALQYPGINLHKMDAVVVGCAGGWAVQAYAIVLATDQVLLLVPETGIPLACGTNE